MSPLLLPPIRLRHLLCTVVCKMHLEMDERSAVQCAGIVVVLQDSHGSRKVLSKGSSWTYVLARCGVRKEPQERRGSR